jgi:MoxR-like ATPase
MNEKSEKSKNNIRTKSGYMEQIAYSELNENKTLFYDSIRHLEKLKNPLCTEILKEIDNNNGTIDKKTLYAKYSQRLTASLTTGKTPYIYLEKNKYHITKKGLNLLLDNKIAIKTDINTIKEYSKDTEKPQITLKISTGFIESKNELKIIRYAIDKGKNILIEGATGTGKSFLIEQLAKLYNKKLYTIPCDIDLDKNDLFGKYVYDGSKMVFQYGLIPLAMKNGYWVVFDEVNATRSEQILCLNPILDFRRKLTLKEHDNEEINAHKDFRVFATMNANYSGTNALNLAFRRRFTHILTLEYLTKAKEKQLLKKRTNITDEKILDKLVNIGHDSRRLYAEGKLTNAISTSHLIEFGLMYNDLCTELNVVEIAKVTLNLSDDSQEREDLLNIVKNYFIEKPTEETATTEKTEEIKTGAV